MKRNFAIALTAALLLTACGGGSNEPAAAANDSVADDPRSARYSVRFESLWTAARFPTRFPAGDHFSGLIGGSHNAQVRFWEAGQLASPGIESMAETGGTATLRNEIQQAIDQGAADAIWAGGGLGRGPSATTLEFSLSIDYPQLTLVSMLAPSPDWFVGVSGLSLRSDGQWLDTWVVDLPVWDAGTDNGADYSSANADSQPPGIIQRLSSAPVNTDFAEGVHRDDSSRYAARFTFTRLP